MSENRIKLGSHIELPWPPELPTDGVNKAFVEGRINALQWPSVDVAEERAIYLKRISGYSDPVVFSVTSSENGSPSGEKLVLDGYEVENGDSVLIWLPRNDYDHPQGIYTLNYVMNGAVMEAHLSRHPLAAEPEQFYQGKLVFVQQKHVTQQNGGKMFRSMGRDPVCVGHTLSGKESWISFRAETGGATGGDSKAFVISSAEYGHQMRYRINHALGTRNINPVLLDHQGNVCLARITVVDPDNVDVTFRAPLYDSSYNYGAYVKGPVTLVITV